MLPSQNSNQSNTHVVCAQKEQALTQYTALDARSGFATSVWVGVNTKLKTDENYVCGACANPPPVDDTPKVIEVDGDEFDIVPQFCYLGDMCGERGGCTDAVTARIRAAWKAFHHHLPILTNRGISYARRGNMFSSCVRGVLFHGSESWPMSKEDLLRLQRSDHAMIRWTYRVRLEQH